MIKFIEELRNRLSKTLPGKSAQMMLAPESRELFDEQTNKIDAAILILLFKNEKGEIASVLMKRPSYNGPHSGQVSFPGGKHEKSDTNLEFTALRESHEEIGIHPNNIEIIGRLTELYIPVSNFMVHPFVGYCDITPNFEIDNSEVEYLIEFPMHELANQSILHTTKEYKGVTYKIPYYNIKNEMVWGATSMIISEFIQVLKQLKVLPRI